MVRKKSNYVIWVVLVLAFAGGIWWYYRAHLLPGSILFAVAQTGTINHEHIVMATFANQETPLAAPFSGRIQFICADGQRVKRGETVATLQPEGAAPGLKLDDAQTQAIQATIGGLFFQQTDGLETILTAENLASTDLDKLLAQQANVKRLETGVASGESLGKIVNNLAPTQAFLELTAVEDLVVGKNIRLTVGEQTVSAKILRKSESPMGVVVAFPHYIDGSATERRQEVKWVYQVSTSGVLVPRSALWNQGEEQGVFMWSEGVIHFKKVKILDQDDEFVCIENLNSGVPVVITPREGLEGLVADAKNIKG